MDYSQLTKEQIIKGIKNYKFWLKELSEELKDDKEIVLEAVKTYGQVLKYVSNRLKDDKEIVLEAVKKDEWSLEDASERLQNDKDVVLAATKKNGLALQYASDKLQNDKNILEILEKLDISHWHVDNQKWYSDRMEVLANIREKELMEKSITLNNKSSKKIKF